MLPRAIIPFAAIFLTGMLFPRPDAAVAHGGFGGFHGGGMSGFHGMPQGGFHNAPQMSRHFGARPNGTNRNGRDMRDANAHRDGSHFGNSRFGASRNAGMRGGNGHLSRWDGGQWHTSSGFGNSGRRPSFQGQWQVGGNFH